MLDFSTDRFDNFTESIVGVRLCEKYKLSKGRSLEAYLKEAPRPQAIKLLEELMDEWKIQGETLSDRALANSCFSKLEELKKSTSNLDGYTTHLQSTGFTSEYLDNQTQLLQERLKSGDATTAIGISKELIESCCKTILEELNIEYSTTDIVHQLVKKTMQSLQIGNTEIDESTPGEKTIRKLTGGLAQITTSLAELRNIYGSGHGKSRSYSGLTIRHARLAVGASLALTQYLWDTYNEKKERKSDLSF